MEELHKTNHTEPHPRQHLDDYRKQMVQHAYKHYTLPEYKIWATDTCLEFAQQLSRINSEKCDKEELIKTMLMTEDICCMLRMLLHNDEQKINDIASEIYCDFAEMLKAHGVRVEGCSSYVMPTKTTGAIPTNSLN